MQFDKLDGMTFSLLHLFRGTNGKTSTGSIQTYSTLRRRREREVTNSYSVSQRRMYVCVGGGE